MTNRKHEDEPIRPHSDDAAQSIDSDTAQPETEALRPPVIEALSIDDNEAFGDGTGEAVTSTDAATAGESAADKDSAEGVPAEDSAESAPVGESADSSPVSDSADNETFGDTTDDSIPANESPAAAAPQPAADESKPAPASETPSAPHPDGPRLRRAGSGATAAVRRKRTESAERRRRKAVSALARTAGVVTSLAVVTGTVWALGWMPLPNRTAEPTGMQLTPPIGDQQAVCPGPLLQLGLSSDANQISPVGEPQTTHHSRGANAEATNLGEGGPSVFVQKAAEDQNQVLTAAESVTLDTPKTNGYAATNCTIPASSQWLLAGNTETGHTAALDILNPGAVKARVNFRVFTSTGLAPSGPAEMVLEPGEHKSLSLAGVVPESSVMAVEVIATGAPVAAYIHETFTETLTPRGAEIAESTTEYGTTQFLPGVVVSAWPVDGPDTTATIGTAVRLLNPGDAETTVALQVLDENGKVAFRDDVPVAPNTVFDYPVGTVPDGKYTIRVDAPTPIVAAARVAPLDSSEFGWLASSPALSDSALIAVPEGDSPRLAVMNPGETREITVNGKRVKIAEGATYETDISGDTVELAGVSGMRAAVHFVAPGAYSGFPVHPSISEGDTITVYR